jgi:hypothetical protein
MTWGEFKCAVEAHEVDDKAIIWLVAIDLTIPPSLLFQADEVIR